VIDAAVSTHLSTGLDSASFVAGTWTLTMSARSPKLVRLDDNGATHLSCLDIVAISSTKGSSGALWKSDPRLRVSLNTRPSRAARACRLAAATFAGQSRYPLACERFARFRTTLVSRQRDARLAVTAGPLGEDRRTIAHSNLPHPAFARRLTRAGLRHAPSAATIPTVQLSAVA
jgi:hypothetical protein